MTEKPTRQKLSYDGQKSELMSSADERESNNLLDIEDEKPD